MPHLMARAHGWQTRIPAISMDVRNLDSTCLAFHYAPFGEAMTACPGSSIIATARGLALLLLTLPGAPQASGAGDVGCDSSAAFQRAFKCCFGVPPTSWAARRNSPVELFQAAGGL